jgi:hypothetical protein
MPRLAVDSAEVAPLQHVRWFVKNITTSQSFAFFLSRTCHL